MTQRRYYHGTEEKSGFLRNTLEAGLANYVYSFYYVSSGNDTLGSISGEMAPKKTVVDRKMLKAMTYSILHRRKLEQLKSTWNIVKDCVMASAML